MFARFFFPDVQTVAKCLTHVILYARSTEVNFSFGPLELSEILESGLWMDGEIGPVADIIGGLPGVVRHDE